MTLARQVELILNAAAGAFASAVARGDFDAAEKLAIVAFDARDRGGTQA